MKWHVLLVAIAVVLAGCGTGVLQPSGDTATTTTTTTLPTSTTTTATETSTTTTLSPPTTTSTTPTTTTTTSPDNQWGKNPVTVAVEHYADSDRNVTPLVHDAIAYWNNHSEKYAGVNVTFELVAFTTEADIRLAYTPNLPRCGADTGDHLGCADVIEPGDQPPQQAEVKVLAGYDDRTTKQTIKHELGHVLGLQHADAPQPLMNETAGYSATLPKPNATELEFPWRNRNLTVYVDNNGHDYHASQVSHALEYFEDGADGTLSVTPRFTEVDSRERADIVIRLHESPRATEWLDEDGSRWRVFGRDPDADDALEYYTNATIVVAGIDHDASGWHVASGLAGALGYTEEELPPPLKDADYDDRRSEWWR